jgi:hypothetical protein
MFLNFKDLSDFAVLQALRDELNDIFLANRPMDQASGIGSPSVLAQS